MKLATELYVDFSTTLGEALYNELFNEYRFCSMLVAKDFDYIDSSSPLIDMIVDRFCGKEGNRPMTELFTLYTDIVEKLCQRNGKIAWFDDEVEDLIGRIRNFRKRVEELFAKYQASEMKALKWHVL